MLGKIVKSSLWLSLFTFISKVFGFLRDVCLASTFGSGTISDIINLAFRLPNFFKQIFSEGALSNIFITTFKSHKEKSYEDAKIFSNSIFWSILIISIILLIIIELYIQDFFFYFFLKLHYLKKI